MHVQELMSHPAVTCHVNDTLNRAAQLMWDHDCGALPVVDGERKVVGMITDRDVCMAAYTKGSALSALSVSEAMATDVVTCSVEQSVSEVEQVMRRRKVRRVPVIDAQRHPIGMLSISDIACEAAMSNGRNGLERALIETLGEISASRRPTSEVFRPTDERLRETALQSVRLA